MNDHDLAIVRKAIDYVKDHLKSDSSGHDHHHAMRVYQMAMKLGLNHDVDDSVVALAALLHDLDDPKISAGTERAITFLKQYCPDRLDAVMHVIDNMSFNRQKKGHTVESLEGKIVQDADRLDALGAIGIARVFAYSGATGRPLFLGDKDDESAVAHFYQKLFKLPELMNTEEAMAIALGRVSYMKDYLERFYAEWEGE